MAHELSIRKSGKVEMAYLETDSTPWHSLGNLVPENASLEVWMQEAGMDWEVIPSTVQYSDLSGNQLKFDDKRVLYRSDDMRPLSVVSNKFNIVQPREVIEFFNDLIQMNDMKMSTAGVLYEGRRFWALAETKESFILNENDLNKCYVLLTTSVDGSLATTAKLTSTRVVCNNTINIALKDGNEMFKTSHRQVFDANQVKIDMGLLSESFYDYQQTIRKLAEVEVTESFAKNFIRDLVSKPNLSAQDQPRTIVPMIDDIMRRFKSGIGNQGRTAWDILNAVTEFSTHSGKQRSFDSKFDSVYNGNGAKLAMNAFRKLESVA
jgi:phage/plasmid-like protein (TIGR03299 family)